MNLLSRILMDGGFDLIAFFDNAAGYVQELGNYIMILAGVILIIVAVVQIAKGLAGGGRGQVNWVMSIACLLVGGMLVFGGWNLAASLAETGKETIETLGGGTIGGAGVEENGGGASSEGLVNKSRGE